MIDNSSPPMGEFYTEARANEMVAEERAKWLSVIEDIKAEIEGEGKKAFSYPNWEFAKGLDKAVEIIDRKIADAKGDKA